MSAPAMNAALIRFSKHRIHKMKTIHKILLGVVAAGALAAATQATSYAAPYHHGRYVYHHGHYGYYYGHVFYPYYAGPYPYYYGPYYGPGVSVVVPAPVVVAPRRHFFFFF
jgi:hypothetical protein